MGLDKDCIPYYASLKGAGLEEGDSDEERTQPDI